MPDDDSFHKVPASVSMEQLQSLNTVGTISYVLHLIVAVSAFIPGGQFGVALLLSLIHI